MRDEAAVTADLAPVEPHDRGGPRLHVPAAFGAGRAKPFFLPLPATGQRPMRFAAEGLPEGLAMDEARGLIAGCVGREGEWTVRVTARNAHGEDEAEVRIIVGGRLALTPPLGWNSWNAFGREVDAARVRAAAEAMVSSGLAAHGYSHVNIDDGWQGERSGPHGALQGNEKFPDMRGLCDAVHSLGLRIGIYSTPWVKSYAGFTGGSSGEFARSAWRQPREAGRYFGKMPHHREDARQWAEWGFDYLKYDWNPWEVEDVEAMAEALRACGRDIVYSLSNAAPFERAAEWAQLAHLWRTTGDLFDTWESLSAIAFSQDRWTPYGGPGHWNDPDMLVVGRVKWGGDARPNRLAPDEQVLHVTLWALLAAPLMVGCDLERLDDFTLRLLANDEVLEVNQDPLGRQGRCLREERRTDAGGAAVQHTHVFVRELADGSQAAALVNRGPKEETIRVTWKELALSGFRKVRDLWARKDVGRMSEALELRVPPHGARLVRVAR